MKAPDKDQPSIRRLRTLIGAALVLVVVLGGYSWWRLRAPAPYVVQLPGGSLGSEEREDAADASEAPVEFSSTAQDDPAAWRAEFDELNKISNETRRLEALHRFGLMLAEQNLSAALAFAEKLPPSPERERVLGAIVQTWARRDPAPAVAYAEKIPAGDFGDYLLSETLGIWVGQAPLAAAEWALKSATPERAAIACSAVAEAWANGDPTGAAAWAAALPAGETRDRAMSLVVGAWAATDPNAALGYAAQIVSPEQKQGAFSDIMATWGESAPVEAARWIQANLDLKTNTGPIISLLLAWQLADAPAALKWVRELPDPAVRSGALPQLFASWAGMDPAAASAAIASLGETAERGVAVFGLVSNWAQNDPAGAANWLAKQSPALQLAGMDPTVRALAQADLQEADRWVRALPPGQARDRGLAGYSDRMFQRDPAAALGVALDIEHPISRDQHLTKLFVNWAKLAPADAQAWAASSQLSPTLRTKLGKVLAAPSGAPEQR